jgi:hypothetical protein
VLQNIHSRVSYTWSFYNCKIFPIRFFINSFDKYIFKFKLDIHFFESIFFHSVLILLSLFIFISIYQKSKFYSDNTFFLVYIEFLS